MTRQRRSTSEARRFIERELPALACDDMVGLLGRRAAAACFRARWLTLTALDWSRGRRRSRPQAKSPWAKRGLRR